MVTRVHAGDGRLLAEYATERRVFVPYEAMPKRLVNAILSLRGASRPRAGGLETTRRPTA